jgi:hypothetical protein
MFLQDNLDQTMGAKLCPSPHLRDTIAPVHAKLWPGGAGGLGEWVGGRDQLFYALQLTMDFINASIVFISYEPTLITFPVYR